MIASLVFRYSLAALIMFSVVEPIHAECQSCECLQSAERFIFDIPKEDHLGLELVKQTCISTSLPAPKDEFLINNLQRWRTQAESGGALHACRGYWAEIATDLQHRVGCDNACTGSGADLAIVQRRDDDQYLAKRYSEVRRASPEEHTCAAAALSAMNVIVRFENAAFLHSLVESSNSVSELIRASGREVNSAFYVLTQHSEMFPNLQQKILDLRLRLWKSEAIGDGYSIAALADRINIHRNHQQVYGTHTICTSEGAAFSPPLADSVELTNRRRKSLGLRGVSEFLASRAEDCDLR